MKRILCTSIVLIMLLTGCFAPAQQVPPTTELGGDYTYGVYELDFDIERLSGWPFESWNVVYTHNDEKIESGHQVLLSVEVFTFYAVQVEMIGTHLPPLSYTVTVPLDGAAGI